MSDLPPTDPRTVDLGIDLVATFDHKRALGCAAARKLMAGPSGPAAVD
jgi:hypothetical protein